MQNQNVRLAVSFLVGLIVGVGGYWLIARSHAGSTNPAILSDQDTSSSTQAITISGDNGLAVDNQAPGNNVTVAQVVLKKPGWVAIHDNVNGQPGKILGAFLFDSGKHNGVVPLLRSTVAGQTYIAVLHNDDGDYHHFTPATDKPLLDDAGKPIMVQFTVSNDETASPMAPATTSVDSTTSY